MRVAILGGLFDPPHLGHLLVAQQTLEFGPKINQVWLMPCFSHPWRKPIVAIEHRLRMAKFLESKKMKPPPARRLRASILGSASFLPASSPLCGEIRRREIKVSDFEARQKRVNYTIETVRLLKKEFPHQFFWIIGSDHLKDFSKWKEAKKLPFEIDFLVFPRGDGGDINLPSGFQLIFSKKLVVSNLSSEVIRERIKKGLPLKGMVPEKVEEYIKEHKLYL